MEAPPPPCSQTRPDVSGFYGPEMRGKNAVLVHMHGNDAPSGPSTDVEDHRRAHGEGGGWEYLCAGGLSFVIIINIDFLPGRLVLGFSSVVDVRLVEILIKLIK